MLDINEKRRKREEEEEKERQRLMEEERKKRRPQTAGQVFGRLYSKGRRNKSE